MEYQVQRYPPTSNTSLQAWNAADEYLLTKVDKIKPSKVLLINDRFGYLACHLSMHEVQTLVHQSSQKLACEINLNINKIKSSLSFLSPLEENNETYDFILLQVPKSLALYEFFLAYASLHLSDHGRIHCGFMTKHFTANLLNTSYKFFENCQQSLAFKKSRVLTLSGRKTMGTEDYFVNLTYKDKVFSQYSGVFSSEHIDLATLFLMDHLVVNHNEQKILDIGCGNGILAWACKTQMPNSEIHCMDDSIFAIESAKINLENSACHYHWVHDLSSFSDQYFDLVVTNPPFHFEHEQDINVALTLFENAHRILGKGGRMLVVANAHLNYKTHLTKWFASTVEIANNIKFVIYECKV